MEKMADSGEITFAGLPEPLLPFLESYSSEEILESPHEVLLGVCRIYAAIAQGVTRLEDVIEEEMKQEAED